MIYGQVLVALMPHLARIEATERPRLIHYPYNCGLSSDGRVLAQNTRFKKRIYIFHDHRCPCNACKRYLKEPPGDSDGKSGDGFLVDALCPFALVQVVANVDNKGEGNENKAAVSASSSSDQAAAYQALKRPKQAKPLGTKENAGDGGACLWPVCDTNSVMFTIAYVHINMHVRLCASTDSQTMRVRRFLLPLTCPHKCPVPL